MTKLTWRPLGSGWGWGLLLALVPFLLTVLVRWSDPPAATDGDYAQYLLHAKAIIEGRPYSDIGFIYTRLNFVGPPTQPPGWPVALAPLVWLFGVESPVFKALMTVLVGGFAVVAGMYCVRRSSVGIGVTVAAFVALSLQVQGATGSPISDPLFCLLVWLTLYVADSEKEWTWRRSVLVAALAIMAMTVRVAGVALLPALLLFILVTRGARRWRVALLGSFVIAAGLLLLAVTDVSIPFLDRMRFWDKLTLRQIGNMTDTYRTSYLTGTLYPFTNNRLNDVYHAALIPFVALGAIRWLRSEGKSPAAFFALTYIGLLWFAPVRESRYAWPLLPILVYCLALGWRQVAEFVAHHFSSRALVWRVSAVAVAAVCLMSAGVHLRSPRYPTLRGEPAVTELFSYLRDLASSEPVRVVFENPRVLTLHTGVHAMGVPYGRDPVLIAELRSQGITHVVVRTAITGEPEGREWALTRLVAKHPGQFPVLFRNGMFSLHAVHGLATIDPPSTGSG